MVRVGRARLRWNARASSRRRRRHRRSRHRLTLRSARRLLRNPFYKNTHKAAEVHVLHDFGRDFYGAHLRVSVTGFLRDELNITGVEALIEAIATDIRLAREHLGAGGAFALQPAGAAYFAAPLPPAPSATA